MWTCPLFQTLSTGQIEGILAPYEPSFPYIFMHVAFKKKYVYVDAIKARFYPAVCKELGGYL